MAANTFTLHCAHDAMSRVRGLHGIGPLHDNTGLWLRPCNAIHTFFMGYAIDVVFLDGRHRVLRQVSGLEPNRMACCLAARSVVELPGGYCASNVDYARVLRRAICDSTISARRGRAFPDSNRRHPIQTVHARDITIQGRKSETGNPCMKIEFIVPDMTCGHCVQTITSAVRALDQAAGVHFTLEDHRVKIETVQSADSIRAAIADAGYTVRAA